MFLPPKFNKNYESALQRLIQLKALESSDEDSCSSDSSYESEQEWFYQINKRGEIQHIETQPLKNYYIQPLFGSQNEQSNFNKIKQTFIQESKPIESFEDTEERFLKDVYEVSLMVHAPIKTIEDPSTFFETVLGLVPGKFSHDFPFPGCEHLVTVFGLLPDSSASHAGILIGDCILEIEEQIVNIQNIFEICQKFSTYKKIRLKLQHVNINLCKRDVQDTPSLNSSIAISTTVSSDELLPSSSIPENKPDLINLPYIVLFINLQKFSEEDKTILYQYPKDGGKILEIQGLFSTIIHMVSNLFHTVPCSTTLIFEDNSMNVHYMMNETDALVLVLPDEIYPNMVLQKIVRQLENYIVYRHGSLKGAFKDEEDIEDMERIFERLFTPQFNYLEDKDYYDNPTYFPQQIPLPEEILVLVDKFLTSFETYQFGEFSEDPFKIPRAFDIIGTCFFYKDLLVRSHLNRLDTLDIYSYLQCSHALSSIAANPTITYSLICIQVHPTSKNQLDSATLATTHWYLLLVVQDDCAFCALMEGKNIVAKDPKYFAPDPFYMDQAYYAMEKIRLVGIPDFLEKWVKCSPGPRLASLEDVYAKLLFKKKHHRLSLISPTSAANTSAHDEHEAHADHPLPGSQFSDEYVKSIKVIEEPKKFRTFTKFIKSSPLKKFQLDVMSQNQPDQVYPHKFADFESFKQIMNDIENKYVLFNQYFSPKIEAGSDPSLFSYIRIDLSKGVFITPTDYGDMYQTNKIIELFRINASKIRKVLYRSLECNKTNYCPESEKPIPFSYLEHGLKFSFEPSSKFLFKKDEYKIDFWVVGRLLPTPKLMEVYVCYQNSTPQSMVELAFKLSQAFRY